ncbi:DNA internalization-related competence protein ComEC/Rec2 [Leeia sp. TBRC 13508]|uniref:DNA internalization-related competence protein ComEC/Rec2 n=1 Tax=Leeia speluncae TaxID=2884804 RepID=A0ABS8D6I3_9NEIS|nr:DNA internalization-related competence protein ComEC/Rec2 [Leeia speluncae]MCB6183786.1 DNA internalization-related competence protein ComEC/Rec2 [Leeia speluncae]
MLLFVASWLLGVVISLCLPSLPPFSWLSILLAFVIIGAGILQQHFRSLTIAGVAILFALGTTIPRLASQQHQQIVVSEFLDHHLNQAFTVTGHIASIPVVKPHYRSALFTVDASEQLPEALHLIKISATDERGASLPQWQAGEYGSFTLRIRPIQGQLNPGLQDKETWSFREGIQAEAYVEKYAPITAQESYAWNRLLLRMRHYFLASIQQTLKSESQFGIITALTIGDQQYISQDEWNLFRKTGITHLVSISGLHITLFAWLMSKLSLFLWKRSAYLCRHIPAPTAALISGMCLATMYTVLSGWSVPAQRTLFMLLIIGSIRLSGRHIQTLPQLACALWLILLIDPLSVLAPGFWLSFGAVATLLWVSEGYLISPHKMTIWVRTQLGLTLILTPALLLLFQQFSIISPIANLVAVPVVSIFITPIALAGLIFHPLLILAAKLMTCLMWIITPLGQLSFASIQFAAPSISLTILATLGGILLLTPKGWPGKSTALLLISPIFLPTTQRPTVGDVHIVVLDVGQGLSVYIATAEHDIIFDTGPSFKTYKDSGRDIILPFLKQQGVNQLSGLVVSHNDNDHSGGAKSILETLPVSNFYTSLDSQHPLSKIQGHHVTCKTGLNWKWDDVAFTFLSPDQSILDAENIGDNHKSCVLRISTKSGAILIPGDAEIPEENSMMANWAKEQLKSDILVAGHHGSQTSSSLAWIQTVQPKEVIFTAGKNNHYHHPNRQVVDRFKMENVRTWTSATDGAISIDLKDGRYEISKMRSSKASFWHTRHH